ncbi:MAG TPA: polyprenyl synthetase family protein [Clostridiales bacterium]|nr:polyprenyl synthetase family protein [Clostridiales bacterium]
MSFNKTQFTIKYNSLLDQINSSLSEIIVKKETPEKSIYKAMNYSLMAGGKRLRPVLSLAVCEMLGGNLNEVMPYACAIEMIHTYSLIHDDLPAMDNDDYRRGRLTNHKVFGEARAILAGDALLNYAFENMLTNASKSNLDKNSTLCCKTSSCYRLEAVVMAMSYIAEAAGVSGMIGGQVIDIESEGIEVSSELLEYMHKCKTGALIRAAVMVPAILVELDDEGKGDLEKYSEKIGLAFQIKDDILDREGSFESMGKKTGKDSGIGKSTFVTLYGLDNSKAIMHDLISDAEEALKRFGPKADFLKSLAYYIIEREN